MIGSKERLPEVIEVLGEENEDTKYTLNLEQRSRRVVVTSREILGHSLKELHLLSRYGVTISRISRQDVEFVPSSNERIQFGDALTAVGESEGLDKFVLSAGHRERTLDETDLISLSAGLVLGILLGSVVLTFGGESISLGMAGGPLIVGLILGSRGNMGPIVGRIPKAARFLLAETGLALFLAQAGSQAGDEFFTVVYQYGPLLCIAATLIMIAPLLIGFLTAKYFLQLDMLEAFGGICGAMTSTPGLGVITSSIDSSVPATSYATVYPLALIMITVLVPILISVL